MKRVVFLDWMRVIACFMVMVIHSAEPFYLGGTEPNITSIASRCDMMWITVTECICRVCVPLFVMASAYLLFPVRRPTGEFFRRRLLRVGVPFIVWAAVYVWYADGKWGPMLFNFPDEGGHLWFVPMLLGLYILMPLLSPWAENVSERELKGWISVWLFTTTFPFLRRLWGYLYGDPSFGAVPYLYGECPWNMFGAFHYVSGFIGYMLLGFWFPFFTYADKFPFAAPYSAAVRMEMSIEYCSLGVALATIAAFTVVRKIHFDGAFYRLVVRPVSEASYGMYLVHMLVLTPVSAALIPRMATPLAIISSAAISYVASALLAIAVRRVPVIGKWIC